MGVRIKMSNFLEEVLFAADDGISTEIEKDSIGYGYTITGKDSRTGWKSSIVLSKNELIKESFNIDQFICYKYRVVIALLKEKRRNSGL